MDNSNNPNLSAVSDDSPVSAPGDTLPQTPLTNPIPSDLGSATNTPPTSSWPSLSESSLPTPAFATDSSSSLPKEQTPTAIADWPAPNQDPTASEPINNNPSSSVFPPDQTLTNPFNDIPSSPSIPDVWPPAPAESTTSTDPASFSDLKAGMQAPAPAAEETINNTDSTAVFQPPAQPTPSLPTEEPQSISSMSEPISTFDPSSILPGQSVQTGNSQDVKSDNPAPAASVWNSTTPTFTTPVATSPDAQTENPESNMPNPTGSVPSSIPKENPWGTASGTSTIEQPQAGTTQPSWTGIPENQQSQTPDTPSPQDPTEAAPTDLSHLISSNQPDQTATPSNETLFIPTAPQAPEVSTLPKAHKPIPKWLLGVGGLLLVIVVGASAYFIMGIGQPTETTSIPATTAPQTAETNNTPAEPTAQPTLEPEENSSSNFSELQGSGGSQVNQGTSAAELLRQRQLQQQGR